MSNRTKKQDPKVKEARKIRIKANRNSVLGLPSMSKKELEPEAKAVGDHLVTCSLAGTDKCGVPDCKHSRPHKADASCRFHRPFVTTGTSRDSGLTTLINGAKIDKCGVCRRVEEDKTEEVKKGTE